MGVKKKLLYPPAFILELHDSRSVESSFSRDEPVFGSILKSLINRCLSIEILVSRRLFHLSIDSI